MSSIRYRPEVDGLRAVAVIPVVLYHLGFSWMKGGFTGVDVFFVISGYLITSIIWKELSTGTFSFLSFWGRRIRRIMPAVLAVIIVTLVAGYLILMGPDWESLGRQAIAVLLMSANVEMWDIAGNYWGVAAENAPLLHTWSLAVEEQFYLFYPLILFLLYRYAKKVVVVLLSVAVCVGFAVCIYGTKHYPGAAFYFLPFRAWELAAGGLLAVVQSPSLDRSGSKVRPLISAIGLILICGGYLFVDGAGFPGCKALIPVAGSVLLIFGAGQSGCITTKLLSSRPMVFIGKISYSLYLWHWPVIVLERAFEQKTGIDLNWILIGSIITLLSLASFYLIEQPARKSKMIYLPVSVGVLTSILLGLFLVFADFSCDVSGFKPTVWRGSKYNVLPMVVSLPNARTLGINWEKQDPKQLELYRKNGVYRPYGDQDPAVVVLGSSHGLMWSPVIDEVCKELSVSVSFFCADATDPLIEFPVLDQSTPFFSAEQKRVFDENRIEKLNRWKPGLVIISDLWSGRDLSRYEEFLEFLSEFGGHVLFVEQPPELATGNVSVPYYLSYKRVNQKAADQNEDYFVYTHNAEKAKKGRKALYELCDNKPFCSVLRVSDLYEFEDQALVVRKSEVLYIDDDHLSLAGARLAKNRFRTKIAELLDIQQSSSVSK